MSIIAVLNALNGLTASGAGGLNCEAGVVARYSEDARPRALWRTTRSFRKLVICIESSAWVFPSEKRRVRTGRRAAKTRSNPRGGERVFDVCGVGSNKERRGAIRV